MLLLSTSTNWKENLYFPSLHNTLWPRRGQAAEQDHVFLTVSKHVTAQNCLETLHLVLLLQAPKLNKPFTHSLSGEHSLNLFLPLWLWRWRGHNTPPPSPFTLNFPHSPLKVTGTPSTRIKVMLMCFPSL